MNLRTLSFEIARTQHLRLIVGENDVSALLLLGLLEV
jgi:hypothetical protein